MIKNKNARNTYLYDTINDSLTNRHVMRM